MHDANRIGPLRTRPHKSERHVALDEHAAMHGVDPLGPWQLPPARRAPTRRKSLRQRFVDWLWSGQR